MPSWVQPITQPADEKVTVKSQCAVPHHKSASSTRQTPVSAPDTLCPGVSLGSVHSSALPIFDHYSGLERNAPSPNRSLDYMENYAETSHSGAEGRNCHHEQFSKVKELDARYGTFNNPGRDQNNQNNYYITFVGDNHFYPRNMPDDEDPGINKCVVLGDCQPMAIVSTTIFVTTNPSIAAPYLGIPNCNSENLTVKVPSVRYAFFSD